MKMLMTKRTPILYMIIPCYNEEKVLPVTSGLFEKKLDFLIRNDMISPDSRILFVDDGSKDNTWDIILNLSLENRCFTGIQQSRNRGHQNAVLAGLMEAKDNCDITISIDCDGQDDINAMDRMIEEYMKGSEIVYGVRTKRDTDSFFRRFTAESFYKLLKHMGVETVYNHADYRLVSSRVLQEFENFKEVNIFLRGMFPLVGFQSTAVFYERHERVAGESHYPFSKMLALAIDGITSLSVKPIRCITALGFAVSIFSFILLIWIIIRYFGGMTVQGWASTCAIAAFMGGIQLICLGVIGEYIGRIYLETKKRPRYIISARTEEYLRSKENE